MRDVFLKLVIVLMWIGVAIGIYSVVVLRTSGAFEDKLTGEVITENTVESRGEVVGNDAATGKLAEIESDAVMNEQPQIQEMEIVKKVDNEEEQNAGNIRVLLMTTNYQGIYHESLQLSCDEDFYIVMSGVEYLHSSMEEITITADKLVGKSIRMRARKDGELRLSNIERQEEVSYRGELECFGTENGIVVVNELPVEQYLYGVVPSEMPASYPMAALEAQAISARTYTYYHMESFAYPEWMAHVDDSTSYQVYKNLKENEAVCQAVDHTCGSVITYEGELIESFYYSTSCGFGAGYEVWGEEESRPYLRAKSYILPESNIFVECDEAWYRWCCEINIASPKELLTRIYEYGQANSDKIVIEPKPKNLESLLKDTVIYDIKTIQNELNSLVSAMTIKTKNYTIRVETQQLVRNVLALADTCVTKQDGSTYQVGELLPSAYFEMEKLYEGKQLMKLVLSGGGMGHGVGMSQNGAKCLANEGFCAEDILKYYYEGVEVEIHDENIM